MKIRGTNISMTRGDSEAIKVAVKDTSSRLYRGSLGVSGSRSGDSDYDGSFIGWRPALRLIP